MDDKDKKIESQKTTIVVLSAIVAALIIVIIVMAILYKRTVVINTTQTEPNTAFNTQQAATYSTGLVATSTNAGQIKLETFINTKYGYQLLYPAPMVVVDEQSGGNPTVSGLVGFNGQAVNIPSFTVSASTDTTQSNNNGSLVCGKFINGTYASFPTHGLIFYSGNISTQNGSVLSYCTINHGIKYTVASVGPSTTDNASLLRGAVGSFSLTK